MEKVKVKCYACKVKYEMPLFRFRYNLEHGRTKNCCSKLCRNIMLKSIHYKKKTTFISLTCCACKKPFEIPKTKFTPKVKRGTRKFYCSSVCKNEVQKIGGELSPSWKGGRRQYPSHRGYVMLRIGPNKRMFEHRYIMEKHLGRNLRPKEVVHHLNEIPSDNRIENLVLCKSSGEHHAKYHSKKIDESGRFLPTNKNKPSGK